MLRFSPGLPMAAMRSVSSAFPLALLSDAPSESEEEEQAEMIGEAAATVVAAAMNLRKSLRCMNSPSCVFDCSIGGNY